MPDTTNRKFRARMEEAEPGLFRAVYRGEMNADNADDPVLSEEPEVYPDMHIDRDPAALKLWVEQMAAGMGYARVEWEGLPASLR